MKSQELKLPKSCSTQCYRDKKHSLNFCQGCNFKLYLQVKWLKVHSVKKSLLAFAVSQIAPCFCRVQPSTVRPHQVAGREWPGSEVTTAVLTASGWMPVTGRPPGLVHLVPHQQWPWNSIRTASHSSAQTGQSTHARTHGHARMHAHTTAQSDQWARRCVCDTLTEQSNISCAAVTLTRNRRASAVFFFNPTIKPPKEANLE